MKYIIDISTYGWFAADGEDKFNIGWGRESKERLINVSTDDLSEWLVNCIKKYGYSFVSHIHKGDAERGEWWTWVSSGEDESRKDIWFRVLTMN